MRDGFLRLDHHDAQRIVVRVVRSNRSPRSTSCGTARNSARPWARSDTCGTACSASVDAVHHRDDHPARAGVEGLADDAGLVPRHPYQRRDGRRRHGLQHRDHLLVVDDAVLHVDAHPVETGVRHDLGREPTRDREPGAERGPILGPCLAQSVRPHRLLLLRCDDSSEDSSRREKATDRRPPRVPRRSFPRPRRASAGSGARCDRRPGRRRPAPTSAVSRWRGVTVISSGPSAAGRWTSVAAHPQGLETRHQQIGGHREAVPAVTARDGAAKRARRVRAEHDRDRLLHRTRSTRRRRQSRRSGRGTRGVRRTRGAAWRRRSRRSPRPGSRSRRRSLRNSGSRYPTPRPRVNRPALSTSRLAICLASTTGLRCGRITIPVARRSVVVCAARPRDASSGSRAGSCGAIGDGGTCGSGSTTCSPAQIESNPAPPRPGARSRRVLRAQPLGPCSTPKSPSFTRVLPPLGGRHLHERAQLPGHVGAHRRVEDLGRRPAAASASMRARTSAASPVHVNAFSRSPSSNGGSRSVTVHHVLLVDREVTLGFGNLLETPCATRLRPAALRPTRDRPRTSRGTRR